MFFAFSLSELARQKKAKPAISRKKGKICEREERYTGDGDKRGMLLLHLTCARNIRRANQEHFSTFDTV